MKYDLLIYRYDNYRALIADFFEAKNARMGGNYSYRAFAKEAGFASPNYIRLVTQGKRNLSSESLHALGRVMGLTVKEWEFFEALVLFTQANTPQKKALYLERLTRFRDFVKHHPVAKAQYDYFANWYHAAIRELAALPSFRDDPHWVATQLKPAISVREAKASLALLKSLKLISRDKDGDYRACAAHLRTPAEIQSSLVNRYHSEMLTRSLESLQHHSQEREIAGLTFSTNAETFQAIKAKIWNFLEEIQQFVASSGGSPDRVSQLNIQCFNLAEPQKIRT